jgi:hypothetical protein
MKYPSDLVALVRKRWGNYIGGQFEWPALPRGEHLQRLFEVAYFASLEREEGRSLEFAMCFSNDSNVVRPDSSEHIPMIRFAESRPLTISGIRALAPAASRRNAALVIAEAVKGRGLVVTGILNIGSDLYRARAGKTFVYRSPPHVLMIDVPAPGTLRVYAGQYRIATLDRGAFASVEMVSSIDFVGAGKLLSLGGESLHRRIREPRREPPREWSDFEWTALLNVYLSIVNGIHEAGHGGTLLLTAPMPQLDNLPVRLKYKTQIDLNFLDTAFIDFINARHAYADHDWVHEERGRPKRSRRNARLALLGRTLLEHQDQLADSAAFVAHLASVDGAVVLTSDLRLAGFGAEIVLDRAAATNVYEVTGQPIPSRKWPKLDSEGFGMRHRSAVRFVGATQDTVAFVVSQDGHISFCWKDGERVLLKRGVQTANPNVVGA